uniref:Uncharacterized protein n=1 Tax=Oryza rufipogon TaxID=4529 RepID=A0A0E0RIA9_ORYRU
MILCYVCVAAERAGALGGDSRCSTICSRGHRVQGFYSVPHDFWAGHGRILQEWHTEEIKKHGNHSRA